jgi:hypothetical protein
MNKNEMKDFIKSNLLCFIVWLIDPFYLSAADNLRIGDMRSVALGGNEVTTSALFNPALIAFSEKRSIHVNYYNRFALKELGTVSGSFFLPNNVLSMGGHISSFGYDAYRESLFRLLLGKQLSERWTLGVSVQCSLLQTELFEESQPTQLSTDIGLTYSPVDKLLIGLLIMNYPSVSIGVESAEKMGFMHCLIQAGFKWQVMNRVFISATIVGAEERTIGGSLGIEYQAFDDFSIRAGVKGSPMLPSFGCGYRFSCFTVDAAAVYHPILGISTGVGLSFSF